MQKLALFAKTLLLLTLAALAVFVLSGTAERTWDIPGPAAITLVILALAAFLWVTETVPLFVTSFLILFLALVLPIVRDLPSDHPARKPLILAVPFAANAGGLGTPVGSPPNAIAMEYMRDLGVAPTFGKWMMLGVPGVIIVVFLAWLVLLIPIRSAVPLAKLDCQHLQLTWNKEVFLVLATTLVTILGWLTQNSHGLSTGTISLIPLILFFGLKILNTRDLRSLSWDVLLLMGVASAWAPRSRRADWPPGW